MRYHPLALPTALAGASSTGGRAGDGDGGGGGGAPSTESNGGNTGRAGAQQQPPPLGGARRAGVDNEGSNEASRDAAGKRGVGNDRRGKVLFELLIIINK